MADTITISAKGLLLADERRFWQDIVNISRPIRDKKLHAYANKMVKWIGKALLEVARDQMAEDEDDEVMDEEYIKRAIAEDKKSPADKISEDAMMNAMLDAQFGDSPF